MRCIPTLAPSYPFRYTGEGMEELEFTEADSNLQDLIAEYQQYQVCANRLAPLLPVYPRYFLSFPSATFASSR